MALYRTIQMSFWTDIKVSETFTPEDKYFYLYLFTNPHTNLAGCYEISIRQIVNETGYSKDTVERLFERFSKVHKVAYYSQTTNEVLIVNWHKYNWTSSEKLRKPLDTQIRNIKNESFRKYLTEIFNCEDTVSIPYRYPIDTYCIDTSVLFCSDNTNTNNNINNNKSKNIYSLRFEEAYKAYPRKGEKKKAYSCYQTRLKEGYTEDELISAAKKYAEQCEKEHREERYIKLASTFFGVNTPFVDYLPTKEEKSKDSIDVKKLFGLEFQQTPPYFGFPEQWFDGEELVKERVVPLVCPRDQKHGVSDDIPYSVQDLIDTFNARRRYFNGERTEIL